MDELLDDDIVDIQDTIPDDDIIEQTDNGVLDRLMAKANDLVTPSASTVQSAQNLGETALDFSKGVAGGLTMNAIDELGGAIGAGVESGLGALGIGPAAVDADLAAQGFKGADESLLDKYRQYQQGIEQDVKASEERSPIASTLGQIGGGITGGIALGGALGMGGAAAKAESLASIAANKGKAQAALELLKRGGTNYLKAAPAIAAEAALTSKEQLIGDEANPAGVAADVGGGLLFGLPVIMGMQGIQEGVAPYLSNKAAQIGTKASAALDESPLFRQAKLAYQKYGQQYGVNPKNETAIKEGIAGIEGGTPWALLDKNRAEGIVDQVLKKDSQLGAIVGSSLEDATKAGTRIDAQDLIDQTFTSINQLASEMPSLAKDENFNKIVSSILSRSYKDASPRDIKNAMDEISTTVERIKNKSYSSPELNEAPPILRDLRKALDQRLKDRVPEYRDAAERFAQYRNTYIEQPIAGGNATDLDDIYYGNMKKGEKKLVASYEDLVKRATGESQSIESTEERYAKLLQKAQQFQTAEQGRVASGKIQAPITGDPKEFMQTIKDFADDAAVRRSVRQTQDSQAGGGIAMKNAAGIANTGRGAILSTSYLAGKVSSGKTVQKMSNLSRTIYNAPAQTLSNLATKLEASPGVSSLGKALREGLENGDSAKRNAALFTIMQNPNARLLISAEDFPDEENME